jgi:hypothetical protein
MLLRIRFAQKISQGLANMRTTLNIADDVLVAVREFAQLNQVSLGKALSTLAREGLRLETLEQLNEALSLSSCPGLPSQSPTSHL